MHIWNYCLIHCVFKFYCLHRLQVLLVMAPINDIRHRRQEKKIPVAARKPVKKKAKDKPKRPLSAYNFFFKEERAKIVSVALNEEGRDKDPDLTDEEIIKLKKDTGKVNFEEMGKLIGRRWKNIDANRKDHCNKLAAGDKDRYRIDMEKYNVKKEEMREKKRHAEEQFTQMAVAQGQNYHHPSMMPPSMMRYSEMQASYGAPPMGYAPPLLYANPMDHQNAQYGYHHPQMNMMTSGTGAHNPYYMSSMPPPNHEGQQSPNGPHGNDQDNMNNPYHHYQNGMPHNSGYPYQPGHYRSEMSNINGNNDQSYHSQQEGQQQPPSPLSQNLEPDLTASSTYHSQQPQSYSTSNKHVNAY